MASITQQRRDLQERFGDLPLREVVTKTEFKQYEHDLSVLMNVLGFYRVKYVVETDSFEKMHA